MSRRTLRPDALGSLMRTLHSMQSEKSPDAVPPSPCPYCGTALDAASNSEAAKPSPGDISICVKCAGVCKFGDALTLERVSEHELAALPGYAREGIREHQDAVRAIYLRKGGSRGEA